jgi:hypothetical protein
LDVELALLLWSNVSIAIFNALTGLAAGRRARAARIVTDWVPGG